MCEMADFNVKTLQSVASGFSASTEPLEVVTILADREDFDVPFAFRCEIPPVGHSLRSDGLELLCARAVTMAVAIVGTSQLRVVCQDDSTLEFLRKKILDNGALIGNMQEFGKVCIDRIDADSDSTQPCQLPFRNRSSALQEPHSEPFHEQLFVGIDYGRSDIKTVVVDADDKVLAKYVTR